MARSLKLRDLTRILRSFGVERSDLRGKGSHVLFWKEFPEGKFSYPVPKKPDVKPPYVKGCRRKFRLLPEDGVSDGEFFSR